jgi:hypothetical protein
VRKTVTTAEYDSLYSNCVSKAMLPSIAYGSHKHSCSLKWKVEPMDAYIRRHFPPVAAAVKNKRRIEAVRVIGYDAGPADVRRMERLEGETVDANVRWHYWYPLQEWGWDRERTLSEIVRAGLPPPPKSACFYCPSQKPWELIELAIRSPDLAWQVIQMERAAGPNLDTLDGLWRAPVRGDADAQPRPGSMTEFLLEWMADGRAYAALPSLSAPGVSPTEVRASKVIGKVYRRRLPVAGQDPDLGAAAIEELKVQGRQASAYLGALYQRTFGPYVRASSIAEMAASVNSAIGRLTTAKRALDKAARAGKATDKESAAYVRALASYEDALASYNHARLARGATDTAMARTRAMFDRGRAKAAIRAATRAAASARKRRSTADLAVADADFAVALDWLLRLHREQGKSEKFIAKEQRGFVAKYNSGAETSDDDDAEGDE